jgi:hypothetical protein
VWALVGLCQRNLHEVKVRTISSTIVVFLIVHPSLARIYFQVFDCIQIDGESRLRQDINTLCYQGKHYIYMLVLAMPAICAWVFGAPLIALYIMRKNRKALEQVHHQAILSKSDAHKVKDLRMRYGFLFIGYKTKSLFWELVVIYRKIILVILTVFLNLLSAETQVLAGLLCLISNLILHVRYEPYEDPRLNKMEQYSL